MSAAKQNAARLAPAEDRERAAATVPRQGWRVGALLWSAVAVGVGAIYRLVAPTDLGANPDRFTLVRLAGGLIINSALMYWGCYFTARQSLARRGLREVLRSEYQRRAVNRFGLPLLLPVAALIPLAEVGGMGAETYVALTEVATLFCIYRALTTAYTAHYFDYVVSPSDRRAMENDEIIKGPRRRRIERVAGFLGLRIPRQRLVLPTVQTILVALALQQTVLLVATLVAGQDHANDVVAVAGWGTPAFPIVSVLLWARWHLAGGLTRIARIGDGRPMKSFGWRNPEIAAVAAGRAA